MAGTKGVPYAQCGLNCTKQYACDPATGTCKAPTPGQPAQPMAQCKAGLRSAWGAGLDNIQIRANYLLVGPGPTSTQD